MGGAPCSFTLECNTIGESTLQPSAVCFLTSVFPAFVMGPYGIPKSVCLPIMDSGTGYQGVGTFLTRAATPGCFHLATTQMNRVTSRIMINGCQDLSFLFIVNGRKENSNLP